MTTPVQHFHFTLGPVQGFVAQARRTRDFWAGSFLLSWLAGVAMKAVIAQGGSILFPKPDAGYLAWLEGAGQGQPPRQGSIPNRFKAAVGADFKPEVIVESVHRAWEALAETVWQEDLAQHPQADSTTRAIWDRQIRGFWEISWVVGEEEGLLDRRKNWRSHLPPAEPGIKCALMAGWQELSGLPNPDAKTRDDFWQPLRMRFGRRELAEGEALCAIAFVKRRFARYFQRVRADLPGGWTLRGWRLDLRVPSVLDLAAAHWLERLIQETPEEATLMQLHQTAHQLFAPNESGIGELRCVREAYQKQSAAIRDMGALNSNALFAHMLDDPKEDLDSTAVGTMKQRLKELDREPPAPFYAILLMDGDSLGSLLRQPDAPSKVSRALEEFTREVPGRVEQHNGFLIYAGGDDVLALLPLEDAMRCAADLRQHYLKAFRGAFGNDPVSTLSGAIEYAHVKMPLTRVLLDAHDLLDTVAKDGRGRDTLAVRVWKPGGKALEWAMPWEKALNPAGQLKIEEIAEKFAGDDAEFSSKFFYKIRERFELLNPPATLPGQPEESAIFNESQARALLAVDYLASGIHAGGGTKLKLADAERIILPLLTQSRPTSRRPGEPEPFPTSGRLEADGALLVRFLAHKGVERR